MKSVLIKRLKIALLALGLSAAVTPAWAVTNITFCDEINQPGSYRVTQNLSCQSCPQCLLIDASNVTIDLQGHTLSGDGSSASVGIATPPRSNLSNIEVRNGTVTSFGAGMSLSDTRGARVERMRVFDNKRFGISTGVGSLVTSNIVMRNGTDGIFASGSLVTDNLVVGNGGIGLFAGNGSTVQGNVVNENGVRGIQVICPSLISNNTTVNNSKTVPPQNLSPFGSGCAGRDNAPPIVR